MVQMYDKNVSVAYISMDVNPTAMLEKAEEGFKENDALLKKLSEM